MTAKRALENYLHPSAIRAARGVDVTFGDHDSAAYRVAQACRVQRGELLPWSDLLVGTRKRLRNRAKRWLNTRAVECMTIELLAQRDPRVKSATGLTPWQNYSTRDLQDDVFERFSPALSRRRCAFEFALARAFLPSDIP